MSNENNQLDMTKDGKQLSLITTGLQRTSATVWEGTGLKQAVRGIQVTVYSMVKLHLKPSTQFLYPAYLQIKECLFEMGRKMPQQLLEERNLVRSQILCLSNLSNKQLLPFAS